MKHIFDTKVAELYGMAEAAILENFNFWILHNKANNTNYHDGYYWTYNSTKALNELFPYLSVGQIRRAIDHLKKEGVIITGNYNNLKMDRKLWYAITEKGQALFDNENSNCILQNSKNDLLISANAIAQNSKAIAYINANINEYNAAQPQQKDDTYHDTLYDTAIADYQNNIHPLSSPIEKEQLVALIEEAGAGNVIEAIKRAVKNNARRLSYIETVAKGLADGIDFEAKKKQKPQNNIPEDIRKRLEDIAYARASESSYTELEWKILGKVDYPTFRMRKDGTQEQWFNKLCEAYLEVK